MGKLLKKYTAPAKDVKFKFPLSGDSLSFRRPATSEVRALADFSATLDDDDLADTKMAAKILKMLVPEFSEESEASLRKDLDDLEVPDRASILPFYFKLLGIERDELQDAMSRSLSKTTRT